MPPKRPPLAKNTQKIENAIFSKTIESELSAPSSISTLGNESCSYHLDTRPDSAK